MFLGGPGGAAGGVYHQRGAKSCDLISTTVNTSSTPATVNLKKNFFLFNFQMNLNKKKFNSIFYFIF
jgi:hypothetical protein